MKRPLPAWDPELDDVFVCTAVRPVAPDIATVVLAPRQPSTISFEAGQYVTVEFDLDGQQVSRCYTIASPPTRPERLALTVKRTNAGAVSPWLHDGGMAVGSTVRVGPPQGEFTFQQHPATAYLLLTAGAGITPALSMLREAHDLGSDPDLVVVHSQRSTAEVPYRQELEWICSQLPRVRLELVCSRDERADPAVTRGRLDGTVLARLVPDLPAREILICGPSGYRATARGAARSCGAVDAHLHEESFAFQGSALDASGEQDAIDSCDDGSSVSRSHRIEFRHHGVHVECDPGTTVLDAALAAGLELPFSCAQGLCGTCKSTLLAGDVDMQHAGGIRPREIAAGRVLLCCSTPRSDLVITE